MLDDESADPQHGVSALTRARRNNLVTLFLCGDVMTGRGIDQVLPRPSDARIYESYVKNAVEYVRLAERKNGSITKPVEYAYIWGAALGELERRAPDVRIIHGVAVHAVPAKAAVADLACVPAEPVAPF